MKFVALILCFVFINASCISCDNESSAKKSDERQQNFIDCYSQYVKPALKNSDTVTIKKISEQVDEKGGTLVHFTYEYTTDAGYRQQDSLYLVTRTITLDATLITLDQYHASYGDDVTNHNGKSASPGFMAKTISSFWGSDEMEMLSLWKQFQANSQYADDDAYDLEAINEAIQE